MGKTKAAAGEQAGKAGRDPSVKARLDKCQLNVSSIMTNWHKCQTFTVLKQFIWHLLLIKMLKKESGRPVAD
ncbi:MAG: hypothetical protein Q8S02_13575 [Hydrogenophaga sp.]|nr:hypothetical protein [Hydrogenophaga sp.]